MTVPEQLPDWTPEVLQRFRRGRDRERDLIVDLARVGRDSLPPFTVIGQQQHFTLRDHKSRIAITGKIDARLDIGGEKPPVEIKSWSPNLVNRIETFADVLSNPFTASGAYQLLSYLLGSGEPYGLFLLDTLGLPKLIPVELEPNLDHVERFLSMAETVLDHVEAGSLPDYINDPAECKRCPCYGALCNPPLLSENGAVILLDPELEAALEKRETLKAAADEYDDVDSEVKKKLRGIEIGVIGHFAIRGKWGTTSRVELPADLKRQYTTTNPRGRFTLDIARVS